MKELWRKLIVNNQLPHVVTIIGGGGKTSLMYYLVQMLKHKGYAAVAATTTKLSSRERHGRFMEIQSIEAGQQAIEKIRDLQEDMTLVYGKDPSNAEKMLGIPSVWIDQLSKKNSEVFFVVEGDGSAGKSLKGHLHYEPVIPSCSTFVIVVIGIDSVGTQLTAQYVHRPERICQLTAAKLDALVTTDIISQLVLHPQGYLHNCPPCSVIIPFINKVETAIQQQQAEALACKILAGHHRQITGVMVGSVKTEEGLWLQQ